MVALAAAALLSACHLAVTINIIAVAYIPEAVRRQGNIPP